MGNFYWISGDDEFKIKERARELANELCGESLDANSALEVINADRDDLKFDAIIGLFFEALSTPPFLSDKKIVWLKHVRDLDMFSSDKPSQVVTDCIGFLSNDIPDELTIIVDGLNFDRRKAFAKSLKKNNAIIEMFSLVKLGDRNYSDERKSSIKELFSARGKNIDADAINYLTEAIGGDSGMLTNEIDKIVLFVGDKDRVTLIDCQDIAARTPQALSWEFSGAIIENKTNEALKLLSMLLNNGETEMKLIYSLSSEFQRLIQTRLAIDELELNIDRIGPNTFNSIPSTIKEKFPNNALLKLHPYRAFKVCENAIKYNDLQLAQKIELVRDANRALVSGAGDKRMVLEQLILKLTRK